MIRDTSTQDEVIDAPAAGRRRALVFAAAAVLVVAILVVPVFSNWNAADQSIARDRVRVATVVRGDLARDISAQGQVVAAVKPTLFSPAAGIVSLRVKPGQAVERGELLLRIASPELRNELQQAAASLSRAEIAFKRQKIEARKLWLSNQQRADLARVELVAAEREVRRAEAAHERQAISEFDLAKARDDLARAEVQHRHAVQDTELQTDSLAFEAEATEQEIELQRLRVEELERKVQALEVRSPVTGVVGNLLVADRDAVPVDRPLLTVVDLTAFEVELKVPDAYGSQLAPGLRAEVTHQGQVFEASVVSISPEVVASQVTTRVRFDGADPPRLRQNQRVSARILLEGKAGVLTVDRGPFLESGGGRFTYVVDGDLAERRSIRTGVVSVARVEILDGLEPGEQVVVSSLEAFDDAEVVYLAD